MGVIVVSVLLREDHSELNRREEATNDTVLLHFLVIEYSNTTKSVLT